MAARHVDVVERLFGLSNLSATGDARALSELVNAYHDDASLEGIDGEQPPPGGAGVRKYFEMVTASYQEWQCALDYVQDYGERVLALGALRAVETGGAAREHAVGWIFTFRDDKVAAVKAYPSYGDALRAATTRARDVKTP